MVNLLGEFECKVDEKGRFKVPTGLLRQFNDQDIDGGFVMSKGLDGCLELRTRRQWDEMAEELKKLSVYKKEYRQLLRFKFSGVKDMKVDGADRLLIPKELIDFADVQQELVLNCIMDKVEIWAKDRYESSMISEEEAARIAHSIHMDNI